MIYLKNDTVTPANSWGLLLGLVVIDQVLDKYNLNCGITSLNDSKHSKTSLHYADNTADIRTKDCPARIDKAGVVKEMKSRLNHHYDIILESNHIHIEYQPIGSS